jgi:hypothetical protein
LGVLITWFQPSSLVVTIREKHLDSTFAFTNST